MGYSSERVNELFALYLFRIQYTFAASLPGPRGADGSVVVLLLATR